MVNEVNISHGSFIVMNNFSVEITNLKSIYLGYWTAAAPLFSSVLLISLQKAALEQH